MITVPELKKKNDIQDRCNVYDIDENEFIRRPTEDTFDPEKYDNRLSKESKRDRCIK